jgi:DNA topoisomerase-3
MQKFTTLVITEKPTVAKDVVVALQSKCLNNATSRSDGCYVLENGMAIAYLFGHMIETVKPEEYPEGERPHPTEIQPFMPYPLRTEPKAELDSVTKKPKMRGGKRVPVEQYVIVTRLMREAKEIINAGDIDREGQLIVDELLEAAGVDPTGKTKPVHRVALTSNHPEDMRQAFRAMERNGNGSNRWVWKRYAALGRQFFDFWLGMSVSMAYQKITGYRRTSAGRVQTAVAWIVVRRDLDIESFKPVQYYVPVVTLIDGTEMRWFRREDAAGQPGFDDRGRIIDVRLAQAIVDAIQRGQTGTITIADRDKVSEAPPLPFALVDLQIAASKRLGMPVKQVEDVAQDLYNKRKMISYVGTDCRYLPESKFGEAPQVLAALGKINAKLATGANPVLRTKAWNDQKIDEHFAIIPTGTVAADLSEPERKVFDLVMRRYAAQFYPPFIYMKTSLAAVFGRDEFRASARETLQLGWKEAEALTESDEREEEASAQSEAEAPQQVNGVAPRG